MMDAVLLVFDDGFDVKAILTQLKPIAPVSIYLFPLTSNYLKIEHIKAELKKAATKDIVTLASASLINEEVDRMRERIHDWSATLANSNIRGKSLKEWFLYPDRVGSAWWLGLLSEKNTAQDPTFFKIAQVNAIKAQLTSAERKYSHCYFALNDRTQAQILGKMAKRLKIKPIAIKSSVNNQQTSLKHKMLHHINHYSMVSAALQCLIWLKDSWQARRLKKTKAKRLSESHDFVFVTYFPNLDEAKAREGVFINRYAEALQAELKQANVNITWLAMPVYYNQHRFKDSVHFAAQLIAKGEKLFLLQEFFNVRVCFKGIVWWFKQLLMSEILLKTINKRNLLGDLGVDEALPYFIYLWRHAFVGSSGIRGIFFYLTYLAFFRALPNTKQCLYFCEMQAWEKALNMAKKKVSKDTHTYAFQHTVVMRNYFNYFYSAADLVQTGRNTDMPVPDTLIANGRLTYQLLQQSAYPRLREAEAIRQLYLNHYQDQTISLPTNKKMVLLVAGSHDRQETKSLISLVLSAFPDSSSYRGLTAVSMIPVEIWFKGSPANPLEPLFAELGICLEMASYTICHQPIAELLAKTNVALIANTTVSIEAAAFGCDVLIPLFADTMLMNPIIDTNAAYQMVSSPTELQAIISTQLKRHVRQNKKMNYTIINAYWHINPTLQKWKDILLHEYSQQSH